LRKKLKLSVQSDNLVVKANGGCWIYLGANNLKDKGDAIDTLNIGYETERFLASHNLVKSYVNATITLGLLPMPLLDLAVLMGLQVKLVHGLAEHYDVPFKDTLCRALLTSLVSGSSSVVPVLGLSSLAKCTPPLGFLGGSTSLALTSGAVTYAVGQVFVLHFEAGGRLTSFKPEKVNGVFKTEIKKGRCFVKSLQTS
jgi:uncharacterized protein (DUF697 family)